MSVLDRLGIRIHAKAKILVIEDDHAFRHLLVTHLKNADFLVDDFAGIENVLGQSGTACTGEICQQVDLSEYKLAFLDHYFQSRTDNGTSLTPQLIQNGVMVIGMSSSSSANESMIRLGAVAARQKRDFRHMILSLDGYH